MIEDINVADSKRKIDLMGEDLSSQRTSTVGNVESHDDWFSYLIAIKAKLMRNSFTKCNEGGLNSVEDTNQELD